jgi:hypothetical protein
VLFTVRSRVRGSMCDSVLGSKWCSRFEVDDVYSLRAYPTLQGCVVTTCEVKGGRQKINESQKYFLQQVSIFATNNLEKDESKH